MKNKQVVGLGQNAEVLVRDETRLLKLFHHGWSLSAEEWEENVTRTVSGAGLPVPTVYGLMEVDGRHDIIYEHGDGPSMLEALMENLKNSSISPAYSLNSTCRCIPSR